MAKRRICRIAGCIIPFWLVICACWAQNQHSIAGPVAGFVFDKSSGILPIQGVPGAATLGSPVLRAGDFGSIALSPQKDYALAVAGRERKLILLRNLSAQLRWDVVDVAPGASRIAVSATGDAAVLYYRGKVEVLTGLPDSPFPSWSLELPAELAAIAVSDGGAAVLAATEGEPASIFLLTQSGGLKVLYSVAGLPSLAFLGSSLDAVVADGASSQVWLIRDPAGQAQIAQIGGLAEGVSRPVAVASANGKVFVANGEPGGVLSLSLSGEEAVSVRCECTPTSLERLADGTSFRLNEAGRGPIWLLDSRSSPPRVVFVPDQARSRRVMVPRPIPVGRGGEL